MWSRRRFLVQGTSGVLGLAAWATAAERPDERAIEGKLPGPPLTPACRTAIDAGLKYLATNQLKDGSFGTNQYAGSVAVTGLAGLAFLAGGHLPDGGAYAPVVTSAVKAVLSQEDPKLRGYLHSRATPPGPMYGHAFGTLCLAAACGNVPDRALGQQVRDLLQRAVGVILQAQNREGGWRYTPLSVDADLSVTACQMIALRATGGAGITVPRSQIDRAVEYVKRCQDPREGGFRYQPQGGGNCNFARTAAGVSALYAAGIAKGPEIEAGLKYLMPFKPGGDAAQRHDMHYFYGHYFAVRAMQAAGGKHWSEWYPAVRDELIGRQRPEGFWQDLICHHYGTAMACLILQAPEGYLSTLGS